jgi:hypothetical protein
MKTILKRYSLKSYKKFIKGLSERSGDAALAAFARKSI